LYILYAVGEGKVKSGREKGRGRKRREGKREEKGKGKKSGR